MKTKHEINYAAAGSLFDCDIPAGTQVSEATNLEPREDGAKQYWAHSWPGMSENAESWLRNYGFLIDADDVEE